MEAQPHANAEAELRAALELATGAVCALMSELNMPEYRRVRFTGRWQHLGTITLDQVLDAADAALGRRSAA